MTIDRFEQVYSSRHFEDEDTTIKTTSLNFPKKSRDKNYGKTRKLRMRWQQTSASQDKTCPNRANNKANKSDKKHLCKQLLLPILIIIFSS